MNLDESQKATVAKWLEEGLKVAEVQSRLASELGVKMTYMEVRFLLDDLKLRPKDPPREPEKPAPAPAAPEAEAPLPGEEPPPGGGVKVAVDTIARPGAVVSGKVTFSDGQTGEWLLDQMGRFGLVPTVKGYKPSQEDMMDLQVALQNELGKLGY